MQSDYYCNKECQGTHWYQHKLICHKHQISDVSSLLQNIKSYPHKGDGVTLRGSGQTPMIILHDFEDDWNETGDRFDSEVGFQWNGPVLEPVLATGTIFRVIDTQKVTDS